MATSVSVPAAKLRGMLAAVIPHASLDDTLPALVAVRFEVAGGVLYLAATDRYTMGIARYRIPGAQEAPLPDHAAVLPLKAAKSLRRLLKDADGVAAIVIGESTLSVEAEHESGRWPADPGSQFPLWRSMLGKMLAAESSDLGDSFGVNAEKLARFTAGSDPLELDPLSIRVTNGATAQRMSRGEPEPAPVVLVTRGDWFIGCLMPVRLAGVSVPAQARAEWAAVTAPAEKPEAA